MRNLAKTIYHTLLTENIRAAVYKKRIALWAWLGKHTPLPTTARSKAREYEMLRDEYLRINDKLKTLRTRYHSLRVDPGFFLIEGSYVNSNKVMDCLEEVDLPEQGLVFAHEPRISGLAGLNAGNKFGKNCYFVLDNVEYPDISGRSSVALKNLAEDNRLAIDLFNVWIIAIINNYNNLFATSLGQIKCLKKLGAMTKMELLMNARLPISYERDLQIRKDCKCKTSDTLILYCNNVYENAGAEESINALAFLPKNYKLCFLGEVYIEISSLEKLVSDLGLKKRVFFKKPVTPSRLISYSSGADLAIIPLLPVVKNHTECLPNRVFESIAAENPIIGYKNSEIGRFINRKKIGGTFDSFEPKVMASVIEQATQNENYAKLLQAIRHVRGQLTWHTEEAKLIDAISKIKNKKALIVACKDISKNDRIFRVTDTLAREGFNVTVIAFKMPNDDMRHPDATYLIA